MSHPISVSMKSPSHRRILLLGSHGQVGWEFRRSLGPWAKLSPWAAHPRHSNAATSILPTPMRCGNWCKTSNPT